MALVVSSYVSSRGGFEIHGPCPFLPSPLHTTSRTLQATTTAMLRIAAMAETTLPIFILRVLSPAVVFTAATTLLGLKQQPQPSTQSAITSVVVATSVPRRAAILALLSLAALTYLGDGLVFVVYSVISKNWPRHTAIPLNAVLGLASFSGIAVIGAWKDVAGASVWSLRRVKLAVFTSLALDIALIALLGLEIHLQLYRMSFCSTLGPLTDSSYSAAHPGKPHSLAEPASPALPCYSSTPPCAAVRRTALAAHSLCISANF